MVVEATVDSAAMAERAAVEAEEEAADSGAVSEAAVVQSRVKAEAEGVMGTHLHISGPHRFERLAD